MSARDAAAPSPRQFPRRSQMRLLSPSRWSVHPFQSQFPFGLEDLRHDIPESPVAWRSSQMVGTPETMLVGEKSPLRLLTHGVLGGGTNAYALPRASLGRRCMGGELISECEGLRKFGVPQTFWDQLLGTALRTVRFLLGNIS